MKELFNNLNSIFQFEILSFNPAIPITLFTGGLIVGLITSKVNPEIRGHGLPDIIEAIHLRSGVVKIRNSITRIITSILTIGSGGSAGKVGSSIQIGASISSIISRLLKLSAKDTKLLVICGLSAGVASLFSAPIAGAIFGVEVLYRRLEPLDIIPILIASFTGSIVSSVIIENKSPFYVEEVMLIHR